MLWLPIGCNLQPLATITIVQQQHADQYTLLSVSDSDHYCQHRTAIHATQLVAACAAAIWRYEHRMLLRVGDVVCDLL